MAARRFDPEALLDPSAYPHRPRGVTLVETHISWVFLAGDRVYKVKKPVDFGFLDYSTLHSRRRFCSEEVRLNRRLCPETYLGVERIVSSPGGLRVGGNSRAVDYAVVMRRLPANRMLDHLIRRGLAGEQIIDRVAARVAAFHAGAETGPGIDPFGSLKTVRENWQENFDQIQPFAGRTISSSRLRTIQSFVERYLEQHGEIFRERQRAGRIRDCHGDMRAESICVTNGLCIFDCIEFSARLRCSDTASEVAFLAMDIDARGRPDLAYWLIDRYIDLSGDAIPRDLLLFYASYRAFVRGKVQSFRLDQAVEDESIHRTARRRARHYLRLAWLYARIPRQPLLLLISGFPGTGKTTVARALGMRLGAVVYSSDHLRKLLAGVQDTYRSSDSLDAGLYSEEMNRRTYEELRSRASKSLSTGQSVVLDATYRTREDRAAIIDVARRSQCPYWLIECRLPENIALRRIAARVASGEGASDADLNIYKVLRSRYDPIADSEANILRISTNKPIASVVTHAVEHVLKQLPD